MNVPLDNKKLQKLINKRYTIIFLLELEKRLKRKILRSKIKKELSAITTIIKNNCSYTSWKTIQEKDQSIIKNASLRTVKLKYLLKLLTHLV